MVEYIFDPGYYKEPYLSLCSSYPQQDIYPQSEFRIEWGPIFHRGRLDGTSRILVIGQDPAQHETIVRRILVGEAGRRIQGFLAKIGIIRSYTMINTFLYSVYGSAHAKTRRDPGLVDYRNRWIDAVISNGNIEAVITLGTLAEEAWNFWKVTPKGQSSTVSHTSITHPTQPESSSGGDRTKLKEAIKKMLENWNTGLKALAPIVVHPDKPVELVFYQDAFTEEEKPSIPEYDFPAGLPVWMRENDGWARRIGGTPIEKRGNITLTVPKKNFG